MFGCTENSSYSRNSTPIQTMHSLFGIAENSANPLFLQKIRITTNPKCEERKSVYFSDFHQQNSDITKLTPLLLSPRHDNSFETPLAYLST